MSEPTETGKGKRNRSPSFPFIPLKVAIDRLAAFDGYFKRHPAPADKAGLAWQMKGDSSQALQTIAALKAFGLLEAQRSPTGTALVVSEDGRTYLRAQQDSIKSAVLRRAALRPKRIAAYWHRWRADRPPTAICLDELVLQGNFPADGAERFLKVYDQTIAYAGLGESDKNDLPMQGDDGADGDPDEEEGGEEESTPPPPAPTPAKTKVRIMDGERELTTGLLSKGASFRLIVSGTIGPNEIDTLIKKLQIDKAILAGPDEVASEDAKGGDA